MSKFTHAADLILEMLQGEQEDRETIREWYSLLADDATWEEYAFPFVEMLYKLDSGDIIKRALTTRQIHLLRRTVCVSCQVDLMRAIAVNSSDPALRQRFAKVYYALQFLEMPSEDDEYEDYLFYALLCIALDRHREARDYARKLVSMRPRHDTAQSLLEYTEDRVSLPRFHDAYTTRSRNAWMYASQCVSDYCEGKLDQRQLRVEVCRIFDLWLGLPADVDITSPREGTFVFTSDNWPLELYSARASIHAGLPALPDSLQGRWSGFLGASKRYETIQLNDGTILDFSTVITAVVDNAAHTGASVKLTCPTFPHLSYSLEEDFTNAILRMLGVADFCINIRSVDYVRKMSRKPTGTLVNLVEQLEALGYTAGHTIDEVAPIRMRRAYRRPDGIPIQRLRDDIRTGDTACWALQDDYEHNRTDTADYYMNRGIAPVFLAWPRSIMHCGEEQFTQNLIDAISEGDAQYNVQILGTASGNQYCYLDLLAWSPLHLVSALEKYLSRIPDGDAVRIQSFYYDAHPCSISVARTLEHSVLLSLGTAFSGKDTGPALTTPGVKPSVVRPKGKKKNAAKAKRKHSKRHH